MTFSFIKMPGATSVNNEPQKLEEALDKKDEKTVKKVIKGLKGAVKAHSGQVKTLTKDIKDDVQNEGLKGDQHKLDHDKDGDIDGKDFAMMRMKKKKKKMDSPIKDEPEGENGDTASMNPKIGDKTKKEYAMSMKPAKKKLYMSKESKIRTALKSVVEKRGEHYKGATPPETMDDKLKGDGAKKMKADLMKGAQMNDTVAKAPEDAKAAGSRGPSAKPRSSGDNTRNGDSKIVPSGTPMKDPSSPNQRMESIINAYKSMSEMMGNIGVRGSDGKAMGSAPRASSSSSYAGRHNDALSTLNRMTKKHDDRDHIDHAHALQAIDHAGSKLNKHGPDHAEYKKAFDAAKKKSAEAMKSD